MVFTHQCRHYSPQSIDAANGSIGSVGEEGHGSDLQRDQEEKKTHYEDVERYSIILSNALPTGNKGKRKRPHERAMVIMSTNDNSLKKRTCRNRLHSPGSGSYQEDGTPHKWSSRYSQVVLGRVYFRSSYLHLV